MIRHKEDILPPIRILLLVVLTACLGVFQNVFLMELPVPIVIGIPLTVSIAVREKELTSLLFGVLSGVIFDLVSPVHDGVFTLTFALLSGLVSLLARYKVRDTFAGAEILNLLFTAVVYGVYYVFSTLRYGFAPDKLTRLFLPSVLILALLLPVFYYPIRFAESKLR